MIAWLGTAAASDPLVVGGKGATLSRLASTFEVPRGFVVAGEPDALDDALAQLDEPFAVRSSALAEDGATASFAGQHETVLGVLRADVRAAIEACRASVDAAAAYRAQHGLQRESEIPVLVQSLLAADVAAVAFTVDPVTHADTHVVVNASYGLGEAIVSGTVTPDTYRVAGDVVEVQIGAKERMSIRTADGVRDVDVPRLLRTSRALDDNEARAIARLALDVERTLGFPVDVECAFAGGQLYLLQARPVTA